MAHDTKIIRQTQKLRWDKLCSWVHVCTCYISQCQIKELCHGPAMSIQPIMVDDGEIDMLIQTSFLANYMLLVTISIEIELKF